MGERAKNVKSESFSEDNKVQGCSGRGPAEKDQRLDIRWGTSVNIQAMIALEEKTKVGTKTQMPKSSRALRE